MKPSKKQEVRWKKQELQEEAQKYKERFSTIAPPKLTNKNLVSWKENAWLWKEGKEVIISGGGRVLVFIVLVDGGWKKHFAELEKKEQWEVYLEALQFRWREKLLNVNLVSRLQNSKLPIDYILR